MFANKKAPFSRRAGIMVAIPVLALCTAAAGAYVGFPQEPPASTEPVLEARGPESLEDAFWRCDYVGTRYGVHAAPVAFCSEVTARLQEQRFPGNYGQFLAWWRQNKPTEHGKLRSPQVASGS